MRCFIASIIGTVFLVMIIGCSDSKKTVVTVELLVPYDTTYIDTVVIDTVKKVTNLKGTIIEYKADTVFTVSPKSAAVYWVINTAMTIYDTTFLYSSRIDTLTLEKLLIERTVYDTLSTLHDTTSAKDTVIINIDTLFEVTVIIYDSLKTLTKAVDTSYTITRNFNVSHYLFATTLDSTGSAGAVGMAAFDWLNLDTVFTPSAALMPAPAGSRIFTHNNSVYIFGGDSVMSFSNLHVAGNERDAIIPWGTGTVRSVSFTGANSACIIRNTDTTVNVIDLSDGTLIRSINVGAFGATPDDVPYLQSSKIYKDTLYILCQRLLGQGASLPIPGNFPGLVLIIPPGIDSVVGAIPLTLKNPVSMDVSGGYLYVASIGKKDSVDGGIEKINLVNRSVSVVTADSVFGGTIGKLVMAGVNKGYVTVIAANGKASLVSFTDIGAGETINEIGDASGDVVFDGERYLYVGDRSSTHAGVYVIDPITNGIVAGPISVGAGAPYSIAIATVSR